MRSRVASLLARYKSATEQLTMGTFHAVCAKILRHEINALGYGNDFVIFDTQDQQKVMREILEDLRIDSKKLPPSLFGALISRAKNLLQLPAEFEYWAWIRPCAKSWPKFTPATRTSLYRQNALDFDDLLMLTVKIIENFPKVLAKIPEKIYLYFGGRIPGHQRGAISVTSIILATITIFSWWATTPRAFTNSAAAILPIF